MHPIDTILIEHHISPTLITPSQKQDLAHYLALAKNNSTESFLSFLQKAKSTLSDTSMGLLHTSDRIEEVVSAILADIDGILGSNHHDDILFSDKHTVPAFTELHLKLLDSLKARINAIASVSVLLQHLRQSTQKTVCSPVFTVEATLRYVALCESALDTPMVSVYRDLAETSPTLAERISALLSALEEQASTLEQSVSDLITSSSRSATRVNQGKQPQTVYFNLLRAEQIQLHNRRKAICQVKSEVQHVQISDVL